MKKAAKKRPKKRPTKQQMIVLVDRAGNYYEFPRATLERSRVKEHRKKQVAAALKDEPPVFQWIQRPTIPGSVVSTPLKGGPHLQYAGHYLSSSKAKR
jgi:hypothetical protein